MQLGVSCDINIFMQFCGFRCCLFTASPVISCQILL